MKHIISLLTLVLAIAPADAANDVPTVNPPTALFADKMLAAPHLHIDAPAQFVKWDGRPVSQGSYDKEYYDRWRVGTIAFAPDLRMHVDAIRNNVHFPSYYELIDARSGALMGKYEVFDLDDAEWYFSGNGIAYLNQKHLSLCGARYTRKIIRRSNALAEVTQPLTYLGAESRVERSTPLFESPTSPIVVATLAPGSTAFVIGMQSAKSAWRDMAFLVKTPFGLTGWHVKREASDTGSLDIYQCN